MEAVEKEILNSYVGEYSTSAKAYRIQGGPIVFFREVAKFLLEVACMNPTNYCMPKNKIGFIIAIYEGETID